MIFGITGTLAAGKGTIVNILKSQGFKHYSVRDFLVEEINLRGLPVNRDSMVFVANDLRQNNSPSYIIEKIYEKAKNDGSNCVIESLRTPGEISFLKDNGNFYLISINADPRIRYDRATERKSETDEISFERFCEQERIEMTNEDPTKQNIQRCIEMADFRILNNGSIEELKKDMREILKKVGIENFQEKIQGRKNVLSWDEYFMGIAILSAQRSKDPSTQVGACIIDKNKKVVGTGYNGFPRGVDESKISWAREGDFVNTKYAYVCHSELNAILNSTKENLYGCTMYVALFPCNECAKAIIQSGIKKVVYLSDKYKDTPAHIVSKKLFEMAGVEVEELKTNISSLKLNFLE